MAHDFIVVGAGSAGAPVAARLSEDPGCSVLLLEAGPDYPGRAATPTDLLDSRDLAGMAHDWGYTAVPVAGRSIPYRRGKVTGGTSAINAAAAQWGRPEDFDAWVRGGNPEWAWERVLPFFRNLESDPDGAGEGHGRDGPIAIRRYSRDELIPVQRGFHDACLAAGMADVADHNATGAGGAGLWPLNREGTTRISTALAYLDPARTRPNLQIHPGCTVRRVLFEGRRAVGVETTEGRHEHAQAVVLCAGAIASPAILMRSGIGPADHLRALGVEVRLDAPGVGDTLWDHAAVPVFLVPLPGQCVPGRDPRLQVMARFTAEGSAEPDDMQLVMTSHVDISSSPALRAAAGRPVAAVLRAALMVPRGHGRLRLASADPLAAPRIDLNYCADPEDLRRLMLATRRAWQLAGSPALSRATRGIVGLDAQTIGSDQRLSRYIVDNIGTYCHAMGTARMGPDGDAGAVVDQYGRVRGVDNLWIADASVMPSPTRAVPNLTVIMLGERIAQWLREGLRASIAPA